MTMQGTGNIQYQKIQISKTFDLVMSGAPEGAVSMQTKFVILVSAHNKL